MNFKLRMKCNKKLIAILVPTLLVAAAIVGCIIFFIPKMNKRGKYQEMDSTEEKEPVDPFCSRLKLGKDCLKDVKTKLCDGKDCSNSREKNNLKPENIMYESISRCSSEDCVYAAARILRWMDKSVNACEDFYSYSCGNFIKSHSLPEGWDVYSSDDERNEEIELKLKNILEEPAKMNDSVSINNTKVIYTSCMNMERIDQNSTETLKDILSEKGVLSMGEWPLLNPDWNDCRLDIEWKMAKLNALGIDSLVRLETNFDDLERELQAVVSVADPMIDNSCGDETSEKALEHKDLLQSVLEIFEIANISDADVEDVIRFDLQFCNATKDCRNRKYRSQIKFMDFVKSSESSSQINWERWRNTVYTELLLKFPYDVQNTTVDGVHLCEGKIYELLSETPSKVLSNYLTWKFVFHNIGFLGRPFRQLLENNRHLFKRIPMKSDRWVPRWRQCVVFIKEMMPMSLLKAYHDSYHQRIIDMEMDYIVMRVKNEFDDIILNSKELLGDKGNISHKIHQVQVEVAYPMKHDFYNKFYSDIGTLNTSFLQDGMKLMLQRMSKLLKGVAASKKVNNMDYAIQTLYSPFQLEVSSQEDNIIVTLAQLLHSVTSSLPKFKTLSTFGFFIGKELARGSYLKDLKLNLPKDRTRCLKKLFYQQIDPEEKDILESVVDEHSYHQQGIHLAFKAYLRYLSMSFKGDEEGLPGLLSNNRELFFISYAQRSCEIRKNSSSLLSAHRRVNEVLKNSPSFSETFGCKVGLPMNPPKKCPLLWT